MNYITFKVILGISCASSALTAFSFGAKNGMNIHDTGIMDAELRVNAKQSDSCPCDKDNDEKLENGTLTLPEIPPTAKLPLNFQCLNVPSGSNNGQDIPDCKSYLAKNDGEKFHEWIKNMGNLEGLIKIMDEEKNACSVVEDYPIAEASPYCYKKPNVLKHNFEVFDYINVSVSYERDGNVYYVKCQTKLKNVTMNEKVAIHLEHGFLVQRHAWAAKTDVNLVKYLTEKGYLVFIGLSRSRYDIIESRYNLDTLADDIQYKIEKIKKKTGNIDIIYIGYSFGATIGIMHASSKPEIAAKNLKGIISLAPVGSLNNSPYKRLAADRLEYILELFLKTGLIIERRDRGKYYHVVVNNCKIASITCWKWLKALFGDSTEMLLDDLLVAVSYLPGLAPQTVAAHLSQIVKAGKLIFYDRGSPDENKKLYKQEKPPPYDLSRITIPIHTFFGKSDNIATEKDVKNLVEALGSEVKTIEAINPNGKFNHLDFLYAKSANTLLYEKIMKKIEDLSK